MNRIVRIEMGMVTIATRASSGEIVIIMISDADDREAGGEQLAQRLLQALGEVVDVVRHAAQHVAARLAVDVPQRHAVELVLDIRAQVEHRPLHHSREQAVLQQSERGGGRIDREDDEQGVVQLGEVDAVARW